MEIPDNPILFYNGDSPWTLGGVLGATGFVMFLLSFALLPVVIRALNVRMRRLDGHEAATLAMTGHETDYVKPEAAVHGSAVGAEWRFQFTIGDLRKAWHERRYGYFFGVSLYSALPWWGALVGCIGALLVQRDLASVLVLGFMALAACIAPFMMWAAIYTKLE